MLFQIILLLWENRLSYYAVRCKSDSSDAPVDVVNRWNILWWDLILYFHNYHHMTMILLNSQSVHPEESSPCRASFVSNETERQSRFGSIKAVSNMFIINLDKGTTDPRLWVSNPYWAFLANKQVLKRWSNPCLVGREKHLTTLTKSLQQPYQIHLTTLTNPNNN